MLTLAPPLGPGPKPWFSFRPLSQTRKGTPARERRPPEGLRIKTRKNIPQAFGLGDVFSHSKNQAVMSFTSGATVKSAAVAAFTSSTVNSGLISTMTRPSLVTSNTHISVMILVTQWTAV